MYLHRIDAVYCVFACTLQRMKVIGGCMVRRQMFQLRNWLGEDGLKKRWYFWRAEAKNKKKNMEKAEGWCTDCVINLQE
jgi:hypothetical protein